MSCTFHGNVRDMDSSIVSPPSDEELALLESIGIVEGAAFTLGYTADTSVADLDPETDYGRYGFEGSAFYSIGTASASLHDGTANNVYALNDRGDPFHDLFSAFFWNFTDNVPGVDLSLGSVQLRDSSERAFTDDAFPAENLLPLNMWDSYVPLDVNGTGFFLFALFPSGNGLMILSDITTLEVTRVAAPLPGAGLLYAAALGAAGFLRRRTRRSWNSG